MKIVIKVFLKQMLNKTLHNLHDDLPFLAVGMKIKKCNKLVCNINGKKTWLFV